MSTTQQKCWIAWKQNKTKQNTKKGDKIRVKIHNVHRLTNENLKEIWPFELGIILLPYRADRREKQQEIEYAKHNKTKSNIKKTKKK